LAPVVDVPVRAVGPNDGTPKACYVINLYTSVRDELAACELAARIADDLVGEPQVYEFATTVSREDDPGSARAVFVGVVK